MRPSLIVIADTKFPAMRRAPAALRQRLAGVGSHVIYMCDNGGLTLEVSPNGWSLRTAAGQPAVEAPPPEPAAEPTDL